MEMKKCPRCGNLKEKKRCFSPDAVIGGFHRYCKVCQAELERERRRLSGRITTNTFDEVVRAVMKINDPRVRDELIDSFIAKLSDFPNDPDLALIANLKTASVGSLREIEAIRAKMRTENMTYDAAFISFYRDKKASEVKGKVKEYIPKYGPNADLLQCAASGNVRGLDVAIRARELRAEGKNFRDSYLQAQSEAEEERRKVKFDREKRLR